jgi:hypothetical protein
VSRPLTEEEVRQRFLDNVRALVQHWERNPKVEDRCSGVAFSILALLDGCSGFPACKVIPSPHESDKEFNESNGDNWFPEGVDIAGSLHEEFYKPSISAVKG